MSATEIRIRPTTLAKIEDAYTTAQGSWTGCDWTTECRYAGEKDGAGLDLDGVTADAAEDNADNADLDENERAAWAAQVPWLREVECRAAAAEEEGQAAIIAVRAGNLEMALTHAQQACSLEQEYGDCPTWRPLRAAIEAAIEDRDAAESEDES